MKLSRRMVVKSALAMGAAGALGGCATASRAATSAETSAPGPSPSPPTKKTLLILGGTGFLGPALVRAAQAQGHTVTLFNRGKTRPGLFPDVEKLRGDRDGDLKSLEGRRWDAVLDTSGYVPRVVRQSAELLAPSVGQYLFISTISVYAALDVAGMDEDAPLATIEDPANEDVRANYGALKALSEQAAEAAMPGRVTVIRPGLIVGEDDPTDRFTYWPVRVDRGGEAIAPGDGKDPVQFIDVRDLAAWAIRCVEEGTVGVFNALGPKERLPMSALLEACRSVAPAPAALTWLPADFLDQQEVNAWSDLPVWIPQTPDTLAAGTTSNARAVERGLTFRPVEETVRDTLAWWKQQPEERRARLRAGLTAEREAEVLAAWKARSASAAG